VIELGFFHPLAATLLLPARNTFLTHITPTELLLSREKKLYFLTVSSCFLSFLTAYFVSRLVSYNVIVKSNGFISMALFDCILLFYFIS